MAGRLVDTNILQTAVAMGMRTLRENIVLARLVNRDYEKDITGAKIGDVVKVAIPAAITTRAVTANVVPPAVTAVTPTSVSLTVDQWQEAPFAMDDKGVAQIDGGIIPMQLAEAAKSLANKIDTYLWGLVHGLNGFYGFTGTTDTTPFGTDLGDFFTARKLAADQLMPVDDRFMIIDSAAEANALGLRVIQDASMRGGGDNLIRGEIGTIGGVRWLMSQNVPVHSETGAATITVNDAGVEVGDTTLIWDGGGTQPAAGDIFTVAGDSQTYIVSSATSTVITMFPAAQVAWADNAVVTLKGSYVANVLMHRDAIAFAMAPLEQTAMTAARQANTAFIVDEQSGLALRLEVSDQYKQTQWALDALYGGVVVRREYGVFVAG